jgi:hypothetical protein
MGGILVTNVTNLSNVIVFISCLTFCERIGKVR